jgi:hypothetical protein
MEVVSVCSRGIGILFDVERIARRCLMGNSVVEGMAGTRVEYYLMRKHATTQAGSVPVGIAVLGGNRSAIERRYGLGVSLIALVLRKE